jgi:5-methylcytosine-specific restriction endonuclease McrA
MPQIFRSRSASRPRAFIRPKRVSPRQRGYSARWDRISKAYRRENPFCAWCEQVGRLRVVAVVDHKVPVAHGGEMFDPQNWWGLCLSHHGLKAEMEGYARQHGQIDRLAIWCDDPTSRPARFATLLT